MAIWQFIDQQAMEIIKNPEEIEKKIMPYLAELIYNANEDDTKKKD